MFAGDSTDVRVLLLAQYAEEPLLEELAVRCIREKVRAHFQYQIDFWKIRNEAVVIESYRKMLEDAEKMSSDLGLGLDGAAEAEYCKALVARRRAQVAERLVTNSGQDDT